jgi:hypothetical protein
MYPRLLIATASVVALAAGSWLTAAEQATFVLSNGHRVSGVIAAHGRLGTNVRPEFAELSLGTSDGLEIVVPIDRVAVIDFAGGTPGPDELESLPSGTQHALRLRNGPEREGRLIDFFNGEVVRWQNANGRREDIAIRQVSRIYLDTDSARRIYGYRPSTGTGSGRGFGRIGRGSGVNPNTAGEGNEIEVRGAVPWTTTGLRVSTGEMMRFSASGTVFYTREDSARSTPDGNASLILNSYPVPKMGVGGLIARVGNGAPFPIGSNQEPIRMPAMGFLQLGINDDNFADNSGGFRVIIRRD